MKNGDQLSGLVSALDAGKLTLATPYAGTIALDWDQVDTLESASNLSISDERMRAQYLARLSSAQEPAPGASSIPPQEPAPKAAPDAPPPSIWSRLAGKGNLDLGLNHKTASTQTEDYTAALNAKWRHGHWRHALDAHYTRKKDDHVTTSHNYGGTLASSRFATDRFFWQGRGLYKRDWIEEVSHQAALGAGPGYQFWEDDTGALSLAGLIGPARYEYSDGYSENFLGASLRWDYNRYLGGERFEIYTTGELMRPLNNTADISLDATVGLRYRMTNWSSWFLSYSRNQITGGRRSLNEKRVSTGLGLTW